MKIQCKFLKNLNLTLFSKKSFVFSLIPSRANRMNAKNSKQNDVGNMAHPETEEQLAAASITKTNYEPPAFGN